MMKNHLQKAKQLLREAGVASYALDAELLLAMVIKATREEIICRPERIISEDKVAEFESLIKRRAGREPMAHILGKREFWGREFKVTKDTLDPRPDSESLIEAALELLPDKEKELRLIDFGTGTGCLLLTLLAELPNATGVGVDISEEAVLVAKDNASKLGLAKRGEFVVNRWGNEIMGQYDLIISNPPYIKNSDVDGLEPEVAFYEPKRALYGGDDGLECYRELAPYLADLISCDGFVILEIGENQKEQVKLILKDEGMVFVACKKDLAGKDRCLVFKSYS